jgi:hypothetical protein
MPRTTKKITAKKAAAKKKTEQPVKPEVQTVSLAIEKESARAKAKASKAGQPYIQVLGVELDPSNPTFGAFTLDWNDIFVNELRALGFNGPTEEAVVDQWFKTVCQNVMQETYENSQAQNPGNGRRRIDKDRVEVR